MVSVDELKHLEPTVLKNLTVERIERYNVLNQYQKEIFLREWIKDEVDAISDEEGDSEDGEENPSAYISLKPSCKYCKKPLTEDDSDWEHIDLDDLDENGEMTQRLGYTDRKLNTLEQEIENMELQCESCIIEIPKLLFERGLCFTCYDEPWPLMEETPGTIVIEEGGILSCEECKDYWDE